MTLRILLVRLALIALTGTMVACEEDSPATTDHVLTEAEVSGTRTGSGTDLLVPAVKGCPDVDGAYLWDTATDDDVRGFDRTVGGHTEHTVIGAWPMSEETATLALDRISYGSDCRHDDHASQQDDTSWIVEPEGGVGDFPTRSIEVRMRDDKDVLESWSVRAYTYAEGHMIVVWSTITAPPRPSRPSRDGIRELLEEQEQKLAETTD